MVQLVGAFIRPGAHRFRQCLLVSGACPVRHPNAGGHLNVSVPRHGRDDDEPRIPWVHRLETFGLCLLYVTAFWGQAGRLLPAPLDHWHSLLYRAWGPWWHAHVAIGLGHWDQAALYQVFEAMIVAVLVPLLILHTKGMTLRDAGIRIPGKGAFLPTITIAAVSLLLGVYLSRTVPNPWGTAFQEALGLVQVIPEHFLIFGFVGALLLPGGHAKGNGGRRIGHQEALAIAATAFLFVAVHFGVEHRAILIASFPLGFMNAYLTVRTGSIWPAVASHWLMNVVPMMWTMAGG